MSHAPSTVTAPHRAQSGSREIRLGFWIALAFAIGGGLVGWLKINRHSPVAPVEMPRASLKLKDGKLWRDNQTSPFTGLITDKYPDGKYMSKSWVSNGVLEGISYGYYTNGQMQVEEHFTRGVSNGPRIKWHSNGVKASEANIVTGKLEGVFKRWNEDGTLAERIEMKNGLPDGASYAWYPSGYLKAQARLQTGNVVEQKFWADKEFKLPALDNPANN